MNESLGAGITLKQAQTTYYPGRFIDRPPVGVEDGKAAVALSTPQEKAEDVCLAVRDIEPVIEYLQGDDHCSDPPAVKSVEVKKEGVKIDSSCAACQHDSTPEAITAYIFRQHTAAASTHAILHEGCVPQFVEALENVWDHSDSLLAGEL